MEKFRPWFFLPEYQGKTNDYVIYSTHVPKWIEIIIIAWWKITGGKKKASMNEKLWEDVKRWIS